MRRAVWWIAVVLVLAAPGAAVAEVPFAMRYSANEPGAMWVTGSTLMTLSRGGCDLRGLAGRHGDRSCPQQQRLRDGPGRR